jgi:hypothetical protein
MWKWLWPVVKVLSSYSPGDTGGSHEHLVQDSGCPVTLSDLPDTKLPVTTAPL